MRKTDISHFGSTGHAGDGSQIKSKNSLFFNLHLILKLLTRLGLSILTIIFLTVIMVFFSLASYRSSLLKNDIALNINASKMALTSFVYVNDEDGNPQEYQRVYNLENRVWVDFQNIPQYMKDAAVAIEDKRFYEHKGVDWIRTFGAAVNLLGGSQSYGGSTLTQQLIKNITEDNQVSLARKIREIFRATQLEEIYSKDEILESYLNVVNFGSGCRGVQAAANVYFGKNIQDCSLAECATIAGITQNPAAYNPIYHPENNRERREIVLREMFSQNKISREEFDEAMEVSANMDFSEAEKRAEKEISSAAIRNWYVETLLRDVVNDLCTKYHIGKSTAEDMLYTQGLKIYSAMDKKAQNIVENTLKDSSVMPKDKNLQLGYVMMGFDGRILATVGSRNEKKGNLLYDRANVGRRQPGSTIKPLSAYAPAIDWGIYNYSSLIPDEPLKIDSDGSNKIRNWPENWYKSYKGRVTLQWAIEKSANAPAAQVVNFLTPRKSYEFLTKKLEMNSLDSHDANSLAALATGGTHYGVTPREMTAAFQIFGNGGKFCRPYTYFYVTDRNDNVILDNRDAIPTQAISETTATIMNRLLRNVIIGPEGTGRSANIPGWEIIGKTGTTNDDYDSWFIGMSPYAVAGIWTGYDNPKRIGETAAAIRIWKNIMTKYLEGKPKIDYNYSDKVTTANYCKTSGKLIGSVCSASAVGYYDQNNMPELCTSHTSFGRFGLTSGAKKEENSGAEVSENDSPTIELPPQEQVTFAFLEQEPDIKIREQPEPQMTIEPEIQKNKHKIQNQDNN